MAKSVRHQCTERTADVQRPDQRNPRTLPGRSTDEWTIREQGGEKGDRSAESWATTRFVLRNRKAAIKGALVAPDFGFGGVVKFQPGIEEFAVDACCTTTGKLFESAAVNLGSSSFFEGKGTFFGSIRESGRH